MRIPFTCLVSLVVLSAAACDTATDTDSDISDAGGAFPNDSATGLLDSGNTPAFDGSSPSFDGATFFDAGSRDASVFGDAATSDAGGTGSDAGRPDAGASDGAVLVNPGPGVCGGSTPHGCWKPKAGNDVNCPPQIHEQSALYPPANEWVACSSPYYQACIYLRPDGTEANCSCDLGLHWLCSY